MLAEPSPTKARRRAAPCNPCVQAVAATNGAKAGQQPRDATTCRVTHLRWLVGRRAASVATSGSSLSAAASSLARTLFFSWRANLGIRSTSSEPCRDVRARVRGGHGTLHGQQQRHLVFHASGPAGRRARFLVPSRLRRPVRVPSASPPAVPVQDHRKRPPSAMTTASVRRGLPRRHAELLNQG